MYSDYQQPATNKKKIILVSVVMGLIIIALIAVLINAIIRRNRLALGNKNTSNSGLVIDQNGDAVASASSGESTSANSNSTDTTNGSAVAPTSTSSDVSTSTTNSASSSSTTTEASKTSTSNDNLPTTGPAETFGLTFLLGSVAMYLASKKLARA